MPNIRKITDLRNYTEVLDEVSNGNPVFLTKNGTGKYAIVDMQEYDQLKNNAWDRFFAEVELGEQSAREKGWVSARDAETRLRQLGQKNG